MCSCDKYLFRYLHNYSFFFFFFTVGRLNISLVTPSWDDEIANVSWGGEYRPPDCVSRDLLAVVVPYRDRASHLITLLHHLHPILQRQLLHYKIFVVEQVSFSFSKKNEFHPRNSGYIQLNSFLISMIRYFQINSCRFDLKFVHILKMYLHFSGN